jgi:type II secretory pathway pseudopilin PulG
MKYYLKIFNKRGLTLVEVLIGSFIMGMSLLAVGTAIYSQVNALNQNREKTIAALSAQGEIENIRGRAFDNIASYTFDVTEAPGLAYLHKPVGVTNRGAVDVSQPYGADLKKVSVTVTWASTAGATLQNKLETLISRNGIDKQ